MSSIFTLIWGLRIRKIKRGVCFAGMFPLWPSGLSRVAIFAVFIAPKMPKVKRPTAKSVANMLIIGLPSMLDFIYFTLFMPHFWMHLNLIRLHLTRLHLTRFLSGRSQKPNKLMIRICSIPKYIAIILPNLSINHDS
jgi:hypothetical protein